LIRHLSPIKFPAFVLIILFAGCVRQQENTEYIARVNDSYLTEEDLTTVSERYSGQNSFKEEMIRNWVNRELLYQQAVREGIPEDENYKKLISRSEKELAAALMLEKIYSERMPSYKADDLKSFYDQNGDIFKLHQPAYIVNIAEFSDENMAVSFRSAAVESEWNRAVNILKSDKTLLKENNNILLYTYDLQPLKLSRIIGELNPGEISLVINGDPGRFLVVNLLARLEAGTLPPFNVIKENVENRFIATKKNEILRKYYEDLYSANDIEVK
jgi:hypothetical protein